MGVKDKRRNLSQRMNRMGFITTDYDNDSIIFKSGETTFVLQLYENANDYYRLVLPNFYKVNEKEINRILEIINEANISYRCAKVLYVHGELWVSLEVFFDNEGHFLNKLIELLNLAKACALKVLEAING